MINQKVNFELFFIPDVHSYTILKIFLYISFSLAYSVAAFG